MVRSYGSIRLSLYLCARECPQPLSYMCRTHKGRECPLPWLLVFHPQAQGLSTSSTCVSCPLGPASSWHVAACTSGLPCRIGHI
jgi:hypothetical protein